ncbi:MAG: hypothetical protein IPH08_03745 [Rhodocyclaceae bacterium]|nr:hypothetical protein [Rhodocyclaceae bacterium]
MPTDTTPAAVAHSLDRWWNMVRGMPTSAAVVCLCEALDLIEALASNRDHYAAMYHDAIASRDARTNIEIKE